MSENEIAQKLDQLILAVSSLQVENQQLRSDLLNYTATGWQSPLIVARALGFDGDDISVVKKMHRLRSTVFTKPGKHYRNVSDGTRPTYQYHIEECNKALNKNSA